MDTEQTANSVQERDDTKHLDILELLDSEMEKLLELLNSYFNAQISPHPYTIVLIIQ
jgi:hypothetical protein